MAAVGTTEAMRVLGLVVGACLVATLHAMVSAGNLDKKISDVAIALSEIINGLKPSSLTILSLPPSSGNASASTASPDHDNIHRHVDDFIYQLHKLYFRSVIFYDVELYFAYIEANLLGSIETASLIFCPPFELSARLQERRLAHRLSLFIFYWGARQPPRADEVRFEEPIRAAVVTRPRKKAFRIYYNQAVPEGVSNLRLVNWYDADNLGLQRVPLLPSAASVYSNFRGRVFRVPVFHSPPWFWVNYGNETDDDDALGNLTALLGPLAPLDGLAFDDCAEVNVSGGRDHRLLNLLAQHMNFQYVYVEAPGRTQGSTPVDGEANESFTGGIGLLQNGRADFLLGDVSLSWERRKAVEFSFFTLADSGAFATHAPRRLNEALAIIRPFKRDVWPYLVLTIVLSGPIFYAIIAIPYRWDLRGPGDRRTGVGGRGGGGGGGAEPPFHMAYVREITLPSRVAGRLARLEREARLERAVRDAARPEMPPDLLDRCIWFTVQLFLKQSCKELYHGYRAKFLMIVYWVAATYVLADVYSAQLTSQFARPAHEPPINNLQRLQTAMLSDGYRLYVERESSSLEMLENGTEVFRHLFALMKQQSPDEEGYLIDSVEAGLRLIADGLENKAVLGGRETLFFNIQQFGPKKFQLSQKLYTRYSAVAVQIGCPFLDSLNEVLIHLFEGGILEKMTSAEYETQSRLIAVDLSEQRPRSRATPASSEGDGMGGGGGGGGGVGPEAVLSTDEGGAQEATGKGAESTEVPKQAEAGAGVIQPLNLRMLQGAFIVLVCGHGMAAAVLVLELLVARLQFDLWRFCEARLCAHLRQASRRLGGVARLLLRRLQQLQR